jgi:hypothetical protein
VHSVKGTFNTFDAKSPCLSAHGLQQPVPKIVYIALRRQTFSQDVEIRKHNHAVWRSRRSD